MYSIVNAVSLRARVEQTTEAAGPSEMIGRPRAEIPVMKRAARRQRISRICRPMYCALADRPEADQALAINELIETWLPRSTRLHLRGMTYVEREGFVAVRSVIHHLYITCERSTGPQAIGWSSGCANISRQVSSSSARDYSQKCKRMTVVGNSPC